MTQKQMVLNELSQRHVLTADDALVELGIVHLAAHIAKLRREGWDIETTMRNQVNKSGQYAEYRLDTKGG